MIGWLCGLALAGKGVEVPVDIGVGPAAHWVTGPVAQQDPLLGGLAISIEAVLDKKTIRKFRRRIPNEYRQMVLQMDEVRISHPLIPDTLWIHPAGLTGTTGMYGIGWRPLGVGVPLIREPFKLDLSAGPRLTYAYLHSTVLPSPTHFLRPGIDATLEVEIPFSERFLVSFGWDSQVYIPQEVGGSILETAPLDASIWHIGQAFLKFHFRVPYTVKL